MTPGDKNPNRYKKSTLSAAMAALIAAAGGSAYVATQDTYEPDAATIAIYEQFLNEKEGNRLVAYKDGMGLATVCRGLTRIYGRAVVLNERLSAEQCDELNRAHVIDALKQMRKLVGPNVWNTMSPAARVGTSSFCVTNIGVPKCSTSTFIRELRLGHRNDACAAVTLWIKDGGKDCRDRANNCAGQPVRRQQEDELCLL